VNKLKRVVLGAAVLVFSLCVYAFLLGNGVFEGKFDNDPIAWYFLAKGIFCALSLYLSYRVLEVLERKLP
jgi:hypothetical protein